MNKKLLFIFILVFAGSLHAQFLEPGQARGVFLSVGVGPSLPIGEFADNSNAAAGFNGTLSYTDNKVFPFFIYGIAGYQHFPGSQELYESTDYASFSTNQYVFSGGARYFLPPVLKQMVLLMPVVEGGGAISFFQKYHEFTDESGRTDFTESNFKLGFHVGAGFSMFLLDVMFHYYYFPNNQYASMNFKVTIPVYVIL